MENLLDFISFDIVIGTIIYYFLWKENKSFKNQTDEKDNSAQEKEQVAAHFQS